MSQHLLSGLYFLLQFFYLTFSVARSISYTNRFINVHWKSMDWFLYDRDLRHETVITSFRVNFHTINQVFHGDFFVTLLHYAKVF